MRMIRKCVCFSLQLCSMYVYARTQIGIVYDII